MDLINNVCLFIFLSREMPQNLPYHTLHIVLFPLQKGFKKSWQGSHARDPHWLLCHHRPIIARYVAQKSGSIVPHHHKKITFDFHLHDACRHQPIFLRVLGQQVPSLGWTHQQSHINPLTYTLPRLPSPQKLFSLSVNMQPTKLGKEYCDVVKIVPT